MNGSQGSHQSSDTHTPIVPSAIATTENGTNLRIFRSYRIVKRGNEAISMIAMQTMRKLKESGMIHSQSTIVAERGTCAKYIITLSLCSAFKVLKAEQLQVKS